MKCCESLLNAMYDMRKETKDEKISLGMHCDVDGR